MMVLTTMECARARNVCAVVEVCESSKGALRELVHGVQAHP